VGTILGDIYWKTERLESIQVDLREVGLRMGDGWKWLLSVFGMVYWTIGFWYRSVS
jgi:hypothetical protein